MKKIGKHVGNYQYIHLSLRKRLDEADQSAIDAAAELTSTIADQHFNVIKLAEDRNTLTLLDYPDFFSEGFPTLRRYWTVNIESQLYRFRTYEDSFNPPILHRKELLIDKAHCDYPSFVDLTKAADNIGLFDDPNRIGFLRAWKALLDQKGYHVSGNELVPIGNAESFFDYPNQIEPAISGVARHLTALTRYGLSAPIQTLARFGYLNGSKTIFDYGCGKGGDLQGLRESGVEAYGWDPYYSAEEEKRPADIVNLGFVINVIENQEERLQALRGAYELADEFLVVSAMLANPESVTGRPYGDGVLTSRNTFQRYFTQAELSHFIAETLHEEPVPVGPGIFYVFKDKNAEQRFMYGRFTKKRQPALRIKRSPQERTPKPRIDRVHAKYQLHKPQLDALWRQWLQIGRKPERSEVNLIEIRQALGSLPAALRLILAYQGKEGEALLEQARRARRDDLRLYFAQLQFERRKPYKRLEPSLKLDIKHFFGSLNDASLEGQRLLYDLTKAENINDACQQAAEHGLGWLDESHSLQLHTSMVEQLPAILRCYVSCGLLLYGDVSSADLIKIHIRSGKLTLMKFDNFEDKPLPRMIERVKINLRSQRLDFFDYGDLYTSPYLYLKSRFINEEFPFYAEQLTFDEKLEDLKIFDLSGFGPSPDEFNEKLEERRYCIEGFQLKRSQTIPDIDAPCGQFFTYRDLIECGETQATNSIPNLPKEPDSYTALLDLATELLDPIVDYFGMIKLTYGFCSPELARKIPGRIAPKLDQHAAHERNRSGNLICNRGGAAVDFLVEFENMFDVAQWISENLYFDRMYMYEKTKPLHISLVNEGNKGEVYQLHCSKKGALVPRKVHLVDPIN